MADDGLTTIASAHPVTETIDRLEAAVKAKGMTVFARVDHAKGARDVGLALRPTELLIFGAAAAKPIILMRGEKAMGFADAQPILRDQRTPPLFTTGPVYASKRLRSATSRVSSLTKSR
jgi:hypothetical protein